MNRSLWRRLAGAVPRLIQTPFQLAATLAAISIGIAALVIGAGVSAAMAKVLGGHVDVVRLWGGLMLAGGASAVFGRYGGRPAVERAGLLMLGPAYALFGVTILLGLGVGGLAGGPAYLLISAACFVRVRISRREQAMESATRQLLEGPEPPSE